MLIRRITLPLLAAAVIASLSAGRARAATAPALSLDPAVLLADDDTSQTALMAALTEAGVAKPLNDAKLNIYGWFESGYTYNHRHGSGSANIPILPGPFNHEIGDHYMLNQFTLRFERTVDSKSFDVGGLVEATYGSDGARMHATGLGYNGSDPTDDDNPADPDAVNNLHPILQFDIPQAYLTVNLPIGNGLKLMIGKWNTLLGYETVDPRENAFYSHSYLFSAVPYTQTGILGSYQINDQWTVQLGFSRGWDIALEDNNGDAIDVVGQFAYKANDNVTLTLNWSSGPENDSDPGHYRTAIDPIVQWKINDQFSVAGEGLYVYDGGINGSPGDTHHYGDVWGAAIYGSYIANKFITFNARAEFAHTDLAQFAGFSLQPSDAGQQAQPAAALLTPINAETFYEVTLGATITPLPDNTYLKGLMIRPEIRYDWAQDGVFPANNGLHHDQLTFGADIVYAF